MRPPSRVAAHDAVAADADDALDDVLVGGGRREADDLERCGAHARATTRCRSATFSGSQPPGSRNTTMSPRFGSPKLLPDLADDHAVVDEEGVLHRPGRDEERLEQERPHQRGHDERDGEDDHDLARRGAAALRLLLALRGPAASPPRTPSGRPDGTARSGACPGVSRRSPEVSLSASRAATVRPTTCSGGPCGALSANESRCRGGARGEGRAARTWPGTADASQVARTARSRALARPITWSSGTVPPPGSPRWARESAEALRWSPMTQSRPSGRRCRTVRREGTSPG